MTNLTLQSGLVENTFSHNNTYNFSSLFDTNLIFKNHDDFEPYIKRIQNTTDDGSLHISTGSNLGDRQMTNLKAVEILNSAKYPIRIHLKDKAYYIGKGFIGYFPTTATDKFEILFVACMKSSASPSSVFMRDIRFYIDKKAMKDDTHTSIKNILKDVITHHPGDVFYTNNLQDYFMKFQFIPDFPTVQGLNDFKRDLLIKSVQAVIEEAKAGEIKK